MASFQELAGLMNSKYVMPVEDRPTILVSRKQVATRFKIYKGKERIPVEKLILTDYQKKNRCNWFHGHWEKLNDPYSPVSFLDEKWFYTTNRQRKMKELPRGPTEKNAPDALRKPIIRNRGYPVKLMYLGVVTCPQDEDNFYGRIML